MRTVVAHVALLAVAAVSVVSGGCASPEPAAPAEPSPSPLPRLSTPDTLLGMRKSLRRDLINGPTSDLEPLKREVGQPTSAVAGAYGGETSAADVLLISGASGTISDPSAAVERALGLYPTIVGYKPVDPGQLGGDARCGRDDHPDEDIYLTVCGWADNHTVGLVGFISFRPQADKTADFRAVRSAMTRPTA